MMKKKEMTTNFASELVYTTKPKNAITDGVLQQCSDLFSNHYGIWADSKNQIKLNKKQLQRNLLFDDSCHLVLATDTDGQPVGHAFYCEYNIPSEKKDEMLSIRWITQLVVHEKFRQRSVAKFLLNHACSNMVFANVICSSHPLAIRAFEKATGHTCNLFQIQKWSTDILKHCPIPYMKNVVSPSHGLMDTRFNADHSFVSQFVNHLNFQGKWHLGLDLPDGHEFFAITFPQT